MPLYRRLADQLYRQLTYWQLTYGSSLIGGLPPATARRQLADSAGSRIPVPES
jgi:hypothetical protein